MLLIYLLEILIKILFTTKIKAPDTEFKKNK